MYFMPPGVPSDLKNQEHLFILKTPIPAFPHGGRSASYHAFTMLLACPWGKRERGFIVLRDFGVDSNLNKGNIIVA
jgi:hypothetical protein